MKILWIPHTTWRDPQRARLFCEKLSKRHDVHVTDVDACFNNLWDYISRRYIRNYFYRKAYDGNITVHHIPRISPALPSRILRGINYKILNKYVQRIIEHYEIDSVVGTFICKPPKATHLVFDLFDDNPAYWREFGKVKSYADEIEAIEREYIEKADEIVAVSSVLSERIKKRDVHLIPNGVDLARYKAAKGEEIRRKLKLEGVVVGFVGNQNKFQELYKVAKASEKYRDLTFLIVGDGSAIPAIKKYIAKKNIKNFKFTGSIDPHKIPEYHKAIDIGLCPYLKTEGRDAGSPIKLLEYTASGKPVVSTDLEEVKRMDFSNVILVKDDHESLVDGIEKALNSKLEIPKKIENYDIDNLAREYEKVLRSG